MEFGPWLTLLELTSELGLDALPATTVGFSVIRIHDWLGKDRVL